MYQHTEAPPVGKLTEAELDRARMANVITLHRGVGVRKPALDCPPCPGNCDQGDDCPRRTQPEPAEAATSVGHTEPRSAWSPAIVVALCVLLPLVLVSCVSALARWKVGA